ncbi:hypothetical protein OG729_20125 [Streptomyces sp. NBC_00210]|uniref:hypothetical protein n=1 Tax=Streptomyces sp. NBC_00210 TaxID=2903636 RepID=UPI0032503E94
MTNQITSMPATALLELAASYRQEIDGSRAEQRRTEKEAMRRGAVECAEEFVLRHFPDTLAKLFSDVSWQGYPDGGPQGSRFLASAVAALGEGLFLHYTRRKTYAEGYMDGSQDVLTLIRSCPCGNYPHTEVSDDYGLALALEEMQKSGYCRGACTPDGLRRRGSGNESR